jgi:hypothetical protein
MPTGDLIIIVFIVLSVLLLIGLTVRTYRDRPHWPGSA